MIEYEGKIVSPKEGKIAIVVSKFNQTVTRSLLDGCIKTLTAHGVTSENIVVAWVPGAFELPTAASLLAEDSQHSAVICLGCVIKGETPHDTYIAQAVSSELARMGVDFGIPVIFGLLTCNTKEQAFARAGLAADGTAMETEQGEEPVVRDKTVEPAIGNKGVEAAEAALEMIDLIGQFPEVESDEEDDPSERMTARAAQYRAGQFDDDPDVIEYVNLDNEYDEDDEDEFEEFDGTFLDERPSKGGRGHFSGTSHSGPKQTGYGRGHDRPAPRGKGGFDPNRGGKGPKGGKGTNFRPGGFGNGPKGKTGPFKGNGPRGGKGKRY